MERDLFSLDRNDRIGAWFLGRGGKLVLARQSRCIPCEDPAALRISTDVAVHYVRAGWLKLPSSRHFSGRRRQIGVKLVGRAALRCASLRDSQSYDGDWDDSEIVTASPCRSDWLKSALNGTFANDESAAFALLEDAARILNEASVDFVIVGGWVPVLFHKHLFGHPGTYDVDILLHSKSLDDGTFDGAADRMLEDGYLRAVKNRFQAHRILQVGDEELVFHVDFLNEKNQGEQLNLVGGKGKLQSIYTPAMEAVFKYDCFRQHEKLPGVRFPSVETFIASKAVAAGVKKRRRDAFDIYISVMDQDWASFADRWLNLLGDGLFRDANDALWEAVHEGDAVQKVESILDELSARTRPAEDDIRSVFGFLDTPLGVEPTL